MFKKVQKSFVCPNGLLEYTKPLTTRPCLLGIIPPPNILQEYTEKDFKGYINLYMYLLQIRKYDVTDSDYDINDVPFDLLLSNPNDEDVDKMIADGIPKYNLPEAKKLMRNINIISYCNGNGRTGFILKKLFTDLLEKGYTEEETKQILSQIFVLQIVDNYRSSVETISEIPYATIVTVQDIFDLQNTDYHDMEEELNEQNQTMFDKNPFVHIDKHNNSDRRIIYKSFGEGSLSQRQDEHIFRVDYAEAPIINYIMSLYLIKALHMSLNHIEINDNISLQGEIEAITQKALSFIKQKNKDYDSFTKEDLQELNEFLIRDIQIEFKKSIPVKVLNDEEKEHLNEREMGLQLFLDDNQKFDLNNLFKKLIHNIETICTMDNVNIQHIRNIGALYNKFIESINQVIIPIGLTPRMRQELTKYLTIMLDSAKNAITYPKFKQILDEYGDSDLKKQFNI